MEAGWPGMPPKPTVNPAEDVVSSIAFQQHCLCYCQVCTDGNVTQCLMAMPEQRGSAIDTALPASGIIAAARFN